MRSLFLPDGTWAGQFYDEKTAIEWAKKKGYDLSKCEISTRKVERAPRVEYLTADEVAEVVEENE